jgi:hypothetical protein
MLVLCCASPHSFVHSCQIGKLGSVFRSRRLPLILRFFPNIRVSTLFAEGNLHLVISLFLPDETQSLDFLVFSCMIPVLLW